MEEKITIMTESFGNPRSRFFFKTLFPFFILPLSIPFAARYLGLLKTSNLSFIGIEIASLLLYNTLWVQWEEYKTRREVKRLGAQLVPQYRGRLPGNIDLAIKFFNISKDNYFGQFLEKILREYGTTTINLRIFWTDAYITVDEGVVKYILATGFDNFDKGWRSKEIMEDMLGNGVFNRDGEIWKRHRALAKPFFARERIADFETFEKHTSHALQLIDTQGSEAFDAQELFARFTLDTGATFLFNTELDTLLLPLARAGKTQDNDKTQFGAFMVAFEQSKDLIGLRSRLDPWWPIVELFHNKSTKDMSVIKGWLDPIVEKALEANRNRKAIGEDNNIENCSFLEYMAAKTDDVELIRQELLNILLAARDTTSALLTYAIYMFTQHPEVLEKTRNEILSICPEQTVPTYENLREMKYLRAVLNETLRLWPPVPGNGRSTRSDIHGCLIPVSPTSDFSNPRSMKPLYIPPDKDIGYNTLMVHRRKDLWGDDADVFDPDRWLDKRLERMVKNPLIFIPFHAGPRICLGQQFALNEAAFFLVRLLQRYSGFELAPECQPKDSLPPEVWKTRGGRAPIEKIWPRPQITLIVKGGLWIRAVKAQAA